MGRVGLVLLERVHVVVDECRCPSSIAGTARTSTVRMRRHPVLSRLQDESAAGYPREVDGDGKPPHRGAHS